MIESSKRLNKPPREEREKKVATAGRTSLHEKRREEYLERFLGIGSIMIFYAKQIIRHNPQLSGGELAQMLKDSFRKEKMFLSGDQEELIDDAARLWDEKKSITDSYMKDVAGYLGLPTTDKEIPIEEIARGISGNQKLKRLIFEEICQAGKFTILDDSEMDYIDIDVMSRYPTIVITVNSMDLWKRAPDNVQEEESRKSMAGFFIEGEGIQGMAVFACGKQLTPSENEEEKEHETERSHDDLEGTIGHEWEHFFRANILVPAARTFLVRRVAGAGMAELADFERRIGHSFVPGTKGFKTEQENAIRQSILEEAITKTNLRRGSELSSSDFEANLNDRLFWSKMQDECVAYLENQGKISNKGSLRFVNSYLVESIGKEKTTISPETIDRADVLHDLIFFYGIAGISSLKLSTIIKTSTDPKNAIERIRKMFPLTDDQVKDGIARTFDFSFRDFRTILDIAEEHNMTHELLLKLSTFDVENITLASMREYDNRNPQEFTKFTQSTFLGPEEKTLQILERLTEKLSESDKRYPDDRLKIQATYNATRAYARKIFNRQELLSLARQGTPARQEFFMEKLGKLPNGYPDNFNLHQEMRILSKKYAMAEKWLQNQDRLSNYEKELMDAWIALPQEVLQAAERYMETSNARIFSSAVSRAEKYHDLYLAVEKLGGQAINRVLGRESEKIDVLLAKLKGMSSGENAGQELMTIVARCEQAEKYIKPESFRYFIWNTRGLGLEAWIDLPDGIRETIMRDCEKRGQSLDSAQFSILMRQYVELYDEEKQDPSLPFKGDLLIDRERENALRKTVRRVKKIYVKYKD